MKTICNRRNFLRTTVIAGAAFAGPEILINLLSAPDANVQVFSILEKHLGLTAQHKPLVLEYTRSLQTSSRHHLSAQAFEDKLKMAGKRSRKQQENDLATYVIEEFVVSTNYLAFAAGYETNLQILKAVPASKKHQRSGISSSLLS